MQAAGCLEQGARARRTAPRRSGAGRATASSTSRSRTHPTSCRSSPGRWESRPPTRSTTSSPACSTDSGAERHGASWCPRRSRSASSTGSAPGARRSGATPGSRRSTTSQALRRANRCSTSSGSTSNGCSWSCEPHPRSRSTTGTGIRCSPTSCAAWAPILACTRSSYREPPSSGRRSKRSRWPRSSSRSARSTLRASSRWPTSWSPPAGR